MKKNEKGEPPRNDEKLNAKKKKVQKKTIKFFFHDCTSLMEMEK